MLGRAVAQGILIGLLVIVPEGAFLYVGRGELPPLVRIVKAALQTLLLLVFGDVQEEFQDGYTVEREVALEGVDLVVAPSPDVLGDHVLDTDDEHVLVVGAVEDADPTPGRSAPVVSPQEVMVGLNGTRSLERRHPAPLRVDTAEDVLDGAVFPSRIHSLQHDEQTLFILRVETLLEILYASALLLQLLGDVFLLPVMLGLVEVYRRQGGPLARLDPVAWVVRRGWRVLHYDLLRRLGLNSLTSVFLRLAVLLQDTLSPCVRVTYPVPHKSSANDPRYPRRKLRIVPDEDRTRQRLPEGVDLRLLVLDDHDAVQSPHLPDPQPPPRDEVAIAEVVEHRGILVPDLGDADPLTRDGLAQCKGVVRLQNAFDRWYRVPVRVVIRMPQQLGQPLGEPVRNRMLEPLGLLVHLLPIVTEVLQ